MGGISLPSRDPHPLHTQQRQGGTPASTNQGIVYCGLPCGTRAKGKTGEGGSPPSRTMRHPPPPGPSDSGSPYPLRAAKRGPTSPHEPAPDPPVSPKNGGKPITWGKLIYLVIMSKMEMRGRCAGAHHPAQSLEKPAQNRLGGRNRRRRPAGDPASRCRSLAVRGFGRS